MLHRVLYHVLSVDLYLVETLGEICCVLVDLVAKPDKFVPSRDQITFGIGMCFQLYLFDEVCGQGIRTLLDLHYLLLPIVITGYSNVETAPAILIIVLLYNLSNTREINLLSICLLLASSFPF